MRNTRQGPQESEGSDAPILQQLMDAMRALHEANEDHIWEQERIQERIQEVDKDEQERLQVEVRAEQELLQNRLMVETQASQAAMETHAQANDELRKTIEESLQNKLYIVAVFFV